MKPVSSGGGLWSGDGPADDRSPGVSGESREKWMQVTHPHLLDSFFLRDQSESQEQSGFTT